jgi:hypothetical protein
MVATVTIVLGDKIFKGTLSPMKNDRVKSGQKQNSVQVQVINSRRSKIKK